MHAILLMTLVHDRYLSTAKTSNVPLTEAFHWHHSLSLFNSKLYGSVQSSERDALWATSAILGNLSFACIEAHTAEDAWPLKRASSLDLNWLKLSDGKREIWRITQPLRKDSMFQALALEHRSILVASYTTPALHNLPSELLIHCGLDDASTTQNNAYYVAASFLAQAWNSSCTQNIFQNFFCFITATTPEYRELLQQKDHRALLLLAFWYAKVCQTHYWWTMQRASLECQAICIYLDRYGRQEALLQQLLQFPRTVCGISAR